MKRRVLITGADRGLGAALTEAFLQAGDMVFAGQYMSGWPELAALKEQYRERLHVLPLDVSDCASVGAMRARVAEKTEYLDILINNVGVSGGAGDINALHTVEKGHVLYGINVLGPLRITAEFLPLLSVKQSMKRLCFVSSESGSIGVCHRAEGFLYPMSKAALNMGVKMLFQQLFPRGFTFRLFHPGWVKSYMSGEKNETGKFEPEESAAAGYRFFTQSQPHEDVLRLIDNENSTWPF